MSFSPISKIEGIKPVNTYSNWLKNYKDGFIESLHDESQLTLILPDDCLIFMGPPRLSMASNDSSLYMVGFVNTFQYSESSSVQPLKAIGSRRHIFAKTNAPVQGSIGRLLFLGRNIVQAMYANATFGFDIEDRPSRYEATEGAAYWTNIEEDLFRIPFGLGVVYNAPATSAGAEYNYACEYLEVCTLQSKQMALQSGQAMIMEQVSFMADRVVPWEHHDPFLRDDSFLKKPVSSVADA